MRRLCVFVATVFAALSSATVEATEIPNPSPGELTADAAVREALASNRELQAAIETIAIARGGLVQAGRLANPELEASYLDDSVFGAEGERTLSFGVEQRFPITARLSREREVASQDVARAEAEVRDVVRSLIAELQSAFYAVRALDERITVAAELIASVRRVEQATGRRLEAAEVSPAEVGLLRIERLRLEQDARRLDLERAASQARLVRLLGRLEAGAIVPVGRLDPSPARPVEARDRPDLEAAHRAVERAQADVALARTEVWEDWTVRLGYERERQTFDDAIPTQQDSFLSLDVRVPIPLWDDREGRIAAADAERRRARRAREALVLRIEEQTRSAEARVRGLRTSVDAYARELIPAAKRSQEIFERGYHQGLVGVAELLQAQRQYSEVRVLEIELQSDLRQAVIDLEAATATSPYLNGPLRPGGYVP